MRRHRGSWIPFTLAKHQGCDQPCDSRIDVDYGTAGKVQYPHVTQPPAITPDPVRNRCINEGQPEPHEPEHGGELHSFGKRTDDQCRGDDGKRHLEGHEDGLRDRPTKGIHCDAAQKQFI